MKCFYSQCKLGGNVEKDVAIKYNTKYYHKECYDKKIDKEKAMQLLKQKGFVAKSISMALSSFIDKKNVDSEFVYFTTKYVIENNKTLNNPFGISYWLQNFDIIKEYEKYKNYKFIEERKKMEVEIDDVEIPKFNKKSKPPKYLKIL